MIKIESKELYDGVTLAKVLHYYNYDISDEKIICPFHGDINPSMLIDYENGSAFCFGCQESFDALKFVKKIENINDDFDGMKTLVKVINSKKSSKIRILPNIKHRRSDKTLYNEAYDYYHGLSKTNWNEYDGPEKDYMIKRGFDADILNLCKAKVNYNSAYPVIFPMLDNGKFRGWVCRTMNKRIEKKRKYLYNEGFSRATTLCGTYSDNCTVIICEGYMDALKLRMFGERNVVAILGWKITTEQINKLKAKGIKRVISALDNDSCGIKGTEYLKNFFEVIRFQYPNDIKDVGEMNIDTYKKCKRKTLAQRRKKNGNNR